MSQQITLQETCTHQALEITEYAAHGSLTVGCLVCQRTVVIPVERRGAEAAIADVLQVAFGVRWEEYTRAWTRVGEQKKERIGP